MRTDNDYMRLAIKEARKAQELGKSQLALSS